jgi:hypothetical protein
MCRNHGFWAIYPLDQPPLLESGGFFVYNEIYYKELTVMGSYSPSPKDLRDSLRLIKLMLLYLVLGNQKGFI